MLLDLAEFSRAPFIEAAVDLSELNVGYSAVDADESLPGLAEPRVPDAPRPVSPVRERLLRLLARTTGQRLRPRLRQVAPGGSGRSRTIRIPSYVAFKGSALREHRSSAWPISSRLACAPASGSTKSNGAGSSVNGIPPLVYPKTIPAAEARYLRDNHIVFGHCRQRPRPRLPEAHPRVARARARSGRRCRADGRLLHALRDRHPVRQRRGRRLRVRHERPALSLNKLMFDEETKSLWSTLDGRPVVGPLVGSDAVLTSRAAVTTTWGEWRRRHPRPTSSRWTPGTIAITPKGGLPGLFRHRLDVLGPSTDTRLSNKAEVLVMRLPTGADRSQPIAIAAEFLARRPVYQTRLADRDVVIVTSRAGANRAYDASGRKFVRLLPDDRLLDDQNVTLAGHRRRACGRRRTPAAPADSPRSAPSGSAGTRSFRTRS